MIPRPSTDELLRDCCRELTEEILPALTDETLKLRLVMTVTVLGNAAVRAANEIAWLQDETDALLGYAQDVCTTHADPDLGAALAGVTPPPSLRLHDVVAAYEAASAVFAVALGVAQRVGDQALLERAATLLRARIDVEKEAMADYVVVGR